MVSQGPAVKPVQRIIVCGSGVAAHLAAVALARQLPPTIRIIWVNGADSRDADLFYGGVTAPTAYAFNLAAGVSEPRLMVVRTAPRASPLLEVLVVTLHDGRPGFSARCLASSCQKSSRSA